MNEVLAYIPQSHEAHKKKYFVTLTALWETQFF